MDDKITVGVNYRVVLARRLPLGLLVGLILLGITIALALGLPSSFKSRAVVLIEAQEIPQDFVRSLVTSFADQRIQVISQRVLTNSNLTSIIEKYDLYAAERKKDPLETVLEKMREDITVNPISADVVDPKQGRAIQATIAFELAYESKSPELAQRVANEIVSLFLNENLKQRSETSAETLEFLTAESEKLRAEVAGLESKLAEFKKGNVERLPELTSLNLELMNRTEQEISQLGTQIQSLQQQRVYLESELAQQKPNTMLLSDTGERILGPADRLRVLQSEFVPLAARYGANHPDVVSKRKEIESLKEQVSDTTNSNDLSLRLQKAMVEYSAARKKYSAEHPDVKRLEREVQSLRDQLKSSPATSAPTSPHATPDNPAYIQLQARLEATDADILGLQRQLSALKLRQAELEDRITKSPEVEREYRMLSRDYETAQAKYQEVRSKRQEAELASSMESKQRGERFTLIEPPVTPEQPSKPNRLAIMVLGVLVSVASGIGSGVVAENVDQRIYGRGGVVRALGVSPLAVIPVLETVESLRARSRKWWLAIAAMLIVLMVLIVAIHFFVSPLDVLFYRVVRVTGI